MTFLQLSAFAGAMFLLAVTPGPGVYATVARAMASGFSQAAMLVLGIVCGDLFFLLFALFGLAAVADLLGSLFVLIRYGGGLYLLWLGLKLWRSRPTGPTHAEASKRSRLQNLFSGLCITLGNPKVILFYLSFLPSFLDLHALTGRDILLVSLTVALVLGTVMLSYAWSAAKAGTFFSGEKSQRWCNRCAGGVLMGTGTMLLLKNQ